MDEPELWRPRGTEVPASRQEAELARSPLHTVAGLLAGWNLQLSTLGGRLLVEQWGGPGLPVRVADFCSASKPLHRPHPGDSAGGA